MKLLDFRLEFYPTWTLIEGRLEDARKKFPGVAIDQLAEQDPSKNLKYLFWMAKQRQDGEHPDDIVRAVNFFDKNQKRLRHKDISNYSVASLRDEQEELGASHRQEKKEQKVSGAELVLETPSARVFYIKSKKACMAYGKGTQWCITQADKAHWERYRADGVEFYFIIDKEPCGDPEDKIAFACYVDLDESSVKYEIFNAEDDGLISSDLLRTYPAQEVNQMLKTIKQHALMMTKQNGNKEIRRLFELGAKSGGLEDVIEFMIFADPKIEKKADSPFELKSLADKFFLDQLQKKLTEKEVLLEEAEKVWKQSRINGFREAAKEFIFKFAPAENFVNVVPSPGEETRILMLRIGLERGVAQLFLNSPDDFLRGQAIQTIEHEKKFGFEEPPVPLFIDESKK